MSHTILPNSKRAIPQTNAERNAGDPHMEQAAGGIKIQLEDPEDPPGEEMAKNARVWKTYVREADRWDKEMVDGRNSSLDVLLIFAALFSAISTAFIIESLGDLKSDPAERSADTLFTISQQLNFIATGQQNTSPPSLASTSDTFTPSYSAVVVNILWLLSLSLSVAVSLIAMLAKEWCYKFMTGRSGPTYNQARRRQQKWDGIEKWKMQEMLSYLPGLMHCALLFFAVGLCIYLWDIHVGVAIPVTAVTAIGGCIYASTTLLPFFDRFCPYSTPATPIVNLIPHILHRVVAYVSPRVVSSDWLESLRAYLVKFVPNVNYSNEDKENKFAHMDIVTSRMLAWMIVNCEDSRSVGVALQAISGARSALPLIPLEQCGAISRIETDLYTLVEWKAGSRQYRLRDENSMRTALRYCRAGSVFVRRNMLTDRVPDWQFYIIVAIHASLFELLDRSTTDTNGPELAVNAASYLLHICLDWDSFHNNSPEFVKLSFIPIATLVSSILEEYSNRSFSSSSVAALVSLLESCAFYITKCWITEMDLNKGPTPTLLLRWLFAVNWYPGGEQPPQSTQDRAKRAVQVMRSYLANPGKHSVGGSFTFGFLALLPYIDLDELRSHPHEMSRLPHIALGSVHRGGISSPTIPESYTWAAHIGATSQDLQPHITEIPDIRNISPKSIALYLLFLQAGLVPHGLLLPVLAIFRHAKSQELQGLCINTLVSAPVATTWLQTGTILDDWDTLPAIFDTSRIMDNYTSAVFIFYFRLLVANMMLCDETELSNRQNLLKTRLFDLGGFRTLKPTSEDGILPSLEYILDHVAEQTDGMAVSECMHRTMQLVADFYHADPSKYQDVLSESLELEEVPEWATKLQMIKDNFKPSRADAEGEAVNYVAGSKAGKGSAGGIEQIEAGLVQEKA
ncbi:transmembrane protein [Ceratobasidium sp. AG-Ba]|nr:transmembrane protein [Ceratobasidium sp. AG-Ba]